MDFKKTIWTFISLLVLFALPSVACQLISRTSVDDDVSKVGQAENTPTPSEGQIAESSETVELIFSSELDEDNQPVVPLDSFPEGVERIFGSFQLSDDVDANPDEFEIKFEFPRDNAGLVDGVWLDSPSEHQGFYFDTADLTPNSYTLEVCLGEYIIASGSFTIEGRLTYEETPFTFTFTNPSVLETYQLGDYDPASEKQLEDPTFEDIQFYVETGRIVVVEISSPKGADLYDKWVGTWVIDALNALPNENGDHYLGLRNVETGEMVSSTGWPFTDWMEDIIVRVAVYIPNEPQCFPTTTYVAINLDVPPFDQLEIRQALAAATDQEAYQKTWGWEDSEATYSFIAKNSWGFEWGGDGYFINVVENWKEYLGVEVELAYCGECADNDKMAADLIKMWESELGIAIGSTSISHDQLVAPIKGQDYSLVFRAWSGSSWTEFTQVAVEDGIIMLPRGEEERFMQLVYDAAMESDPQKQGEMIVELDRLLVEEYVSVIPLIAYEWCPEEYLTR